MKQLFFALPLILAACAEVPPGRTPVDPMPDMCGAAALQTLVGQSQSVLAAMTFPEGTRIVTPGMAVTMDYRPDRLNIAIGEDGNVASVNCT